MYNIKVALLNPDSIIDAEKMVVFSGRLTQRGHTIKNIDDLFELYNKPFSTKTIDNMIHLPHPTLQKFAVINVAIVGASRRFLAQITRHQNEVKFMSASLQYSDYSDDADFVVPYEILCNGSEAIENYLAICKKSMDEYKRLIIKDCVDNDSAAYVIPKSLRNVLIISATPYQWKHMISQRTCNRNTSETQYVMLRVWELLKSKSPLLFGDCGPMCVRDKCLEGKMACNKPMYDDPTKCINKMYPLLKGEYNE